MTPTRALPALALAAGLLLAAGGSAAQPPRLVPVQPPKVVPIQPLPGQPAAAAELPVVPKSAGAFVTVKVSALFDNPEMKAAFEQLKKSPEALDGLTEMVGVRPNEIDRVTLFWPAISARGPGDPVVVVTTREPYNEARLLKSLKAEPVFDEGFMPRRGQGHDHEHDHGFEPRPAAGVKTAPTKGEPPLPGPPPEVKGPPVPPGDGADEFTVPISTAAPGDPLFYSLPHGGFELLFLVDDRTLVFLPGGPRSEFTMMALFAQLVQKKQTGPLADAIASAGNHTIAAGLYLPPTFREFDRRLPPELAPYAALTAAKVGTVTCDVAKTAKVTLKLTFDDAAAARRAAPVLEEGLKTLSEKATAWAAEAKDRPSDRAMAPLLEAAAGGLKAMTVKAVGTDVVGTTEVDATAAAAKSAAELLASLSSRKKFVERTNNLKQIGIALHAYHDVNGFLPRNVYGPKGELLLSWRVHLLPYLEQDNLYKQFKMDEAWDGPTNKKLVEQMPKVFEVPGRDAPKGQTYLQAFLTPDPNKRPPARPGERQFFGRSWLVEGEKNRTTLPQIPDGTSNTLAVVEASTPVVWSKPDDIPFTEKMPRLGGEKEDRFVALFLDGSVRALSTRMSPDTLRLLVDGQDGMVLPAEAFGEDRNRGFPGGGGAGAARRPDGPAVVEVGPDGARLFEEIAEAQKFAEIRRAGLEAARANAEKAAAELARVQELFARGAAAAADVEKARATAEVARVEVVKTEAEVAAVVKQLEEKRAAFRKATETTPKPSPGEKK